MNSKRLYTVILVEDLKTNETEIARIQRGKTYGCIYFADRWQIFRRLVEIGQRRFQVASWYGIGKILLICGFD